MLIRRLVHCGFITYFTLSHIFLQPLIQKRNEYNNMLFDSVSNLRAHFYVHGCVTCTAVLRARQGGCSVSDRHQLESINPDPFKQILLYIS